MSKAKATLGCQEYVPQERKQWKTDEVHEWEAPLRDNLIAPRKDVRSEVIKLLWRNAGVSTVLVEPQVQTYVSALLCLINAPYQLLGLAGSTGFLVWWCYYIGCETLSCQGALPGGSGGCRNSGEELKERFLDLEETSKPIKLNPVIL